MGPETRDSVSTHLHNYCGTAITFQQNLWWNSFRYSAWCILQSWDTCLELDFHCSSNVMVLIRSRKLLSSGIFSSKNCYCHHEWLPSTPPSSPNFLYNSPSSISLNKILLPAFPFASTSSSNIERNILLVTLHYEHPLHLQLITMFVTQSFVK